MKISIVMPTYRPGFCLTFRSLCRINFPANDWEFIFSDEIKYKRADAVARYAKKFGLDKKLKHVQAPIYPYFSIASTINAGIKAATGELVVFMGDYTWMMPDYLTKAWDVYENFQDAGLCGSYIDLECPATKLNYKNYSFSVFKAPMGYFLGMPVAHPDMRGNYVHNWIDGNRGWLTGQFTQGLVSIPRNLLIAVNGYDEMYDNGKGMDDFDMVQMCRLMGFRFLYDKSAIVYRAAHPHGDLVGPFKDKPYQRSMEQNKRLFEAKLALLNRGMLRVWEHKGIREDIKSRIEVDGKPS